MKKHQFILILSLILVYLLFFYLNYPAPKDRKVYLSDLNKSIVNINKKIAIDSENIYPSSYLLWGLKKSKILEKIEETKIKKEIVKETTKQEKLKKDIKLIKRTICLEKKCWEFIGMVTIGNQTRVALLSTDKEKPLLKTFSVGDELLKGLIISKIKGDSMSVTSKEKKRVFILKLFDIDIKPYLQKKRLKDNNE